MDAVSVAAEIRKERRRWITIRRNAKKDGHPLIIVKCEGAIAALDAMAARMGKL